MFDEPKPYRPKNKFFRPEPDGKWLKPTPDDFYTVITKKYGENGTITSNTWFYEHGTLHGEIDWRDGCLYLTKHMPNGRHQTSWIPLTEIIRVDYNEPSRAWKDANYEYHMQEFGMSPDEYEQMQDSEQKEVIKDKIRRQFHDETGAPYDNIHILDGGEGHFTVLYRTDTDDDGE